jgi:hypothetical protein
MRNCRIVGEEPIPTIEGYGYTISCSCPDVHEVEPQAGMSSEVARRAAHDLYRHHRED